MGYDRSNDGKREIDAKRPVIRRSEITRRREKLELSQIEAARRAGMSKQQWYNVEAGFSGDNMRLYTLWDVARALRCRIGDLIEEG